MRTCLSGRTIITLFRFSNQMMCARDVLFMKWVRFYRGSLFFRYRNLKVVKVLRLHVTDFYLCFFDLCGCLERFWVFYNTLAGVSFLICSLLKF